MDIKSKHLKILVGRLERENEKLRGKMCQYVNDMSEENRKQYLIAKEYIDYHNEMIRFVIKLDKELQSQHE